MPYLSSVGFVIPPLSKTCVAQNKTPAPGFWCVFWRCASADKILELDFYSHPHTCTLNRSEPCKYKCVLRYVCGMPLQYRVVHTKGASICFNFQFICVLIRTFQQKPNERTKHNNTFEWMMQLFSFVYSSNSKLKNPNSIRAF